MGSLRSDEHEEVPDVMWTTADSPTVCSDQGDLRGLKYPNQIYGVFFYGGGLIFGLGGSRNRHPPHGWVGRQAGK